MKYRFYLVTEDGNVLVWTHLSITQAKAMNRATEAGFNHIGSSVDVRKFGWEEMK